MRKRTVVFLFVVLGLAAGVIFGWMTIRRGFSARDKAELRQRLQEIERRQR